MTDKSLAADTASLIKGMEAFRTAIGEMIDDLQDRNKRIDIPEPELRAKLDIMRLSALEFIRHQKDLRASMVAVSLDASDLKGRIREWVLSRPASHLVSIQVNTVKSCVPLGPVTEQEIATAMTELVSEEDPVIGVSWYITDEDGREFALEDDDVRSWQEEGCLVHPETGEIISDDHAWSEWTALDRSPALQP